MTTWKDLWAVHRGPFSKFADSCEARSICHRPSTFEPVHQKHSTNPVRVWPYSALIPDAKCSECPQCRLVTMYLYLIGHFSGQIRRVWVDLRGLPRLQPRELRWKLVWLLYILPLETTIWELVRKRFCWLSFRFSDLFCSSVEMEEEDWSEVAWTVGSCICMSWKCRYSESIVYNVMSRCRLPSKSFVVSTSTQFGAFFRTVSF